MTKTQLAAIWSKYSDQASPGDDITTLVEELDVLLSGPSIFPGSDGETQVDQTSAPSDSQAL